MFGSQPERLFSSGDLSEFLAQRRGEMLAAIEAVPAESLLNTPVHDLAEQLVAKHRCEPLALRPEETFTDEEEVSLSIDEVPDGRFMFPDDHESELVVPGSLITFHVPFTGEAELFRLRGSTWSMSMPRGEVRSAELVFAYKSNAPNADQLNANYQRALNQTQEYVRDSSRLVAEFNTRLVSEARSAIDDRREKILRARSTVASLGFPMKPPATSKTDPVQARHDRHASSPPNEETRMTPTELLSRLSKLLPSQFEQVLYLARIPHEHLPAATAAQGLRAVDLMRYVEQRNQLDQLAQMWHSYSHRLASNDGALIRLE